MKNLHYKPSKTFRKFPGKATWKALALALPLLCGAELAVAQRLGEPGMGPQGMGQGAGAPGLLEEDRRIIESALSFDQGDPSKAQPQGRGLLFEAENSSKFRKKLLDEYTSKKLDANPKYAPIFKKAHEDAYLKAAILAKLDGAPVSDSELAEAYKGLKKGYEGKQEYKVKHLVMTTEQDAKDILKELQAGANFEKLAKEKSKDGGSAALGGEAGWLTDCMLGCNYTDGIKAQAKEVGFNKLPAKIIASPMGFFVTVVQQIRPLKAPSMAESKPMLLKQVRQQKFQKLIQSLQAG
jgi:peptidyl-prolyl cis-trans isomerase C